jgi:hypothetical protein
VPVRRVGHRYIVRRCDLLAVLGLDGSGADPPDATARALSLARATGNTKNGAKPDGTHRKDAPDEHQHRKAAR